MMSLFDNTLLSLDSPVLFEGAYPFRLHFSPVKGKLVADSLNQLSTDR